MLVTGGAGFIGSAVVDRLLAGGHEVHVVTRPGSDLWRLDERPVTVHEIDLLDFDRLSSRVADVRPSHVVNAAASKGHPTRSAETIDAWRDTTIGTVSLLESLKSALPEKIVHLGSALEYAPAFQPHTESSPVRPVNARGAAKLAAAQAVRVWSKKTAVPATNLRVFSVYGKMEQGSRVIPSVLRSLHNGDPFRVTKTQSRRDFIDVRDVAQAVLMALEIDHAAEALNVGTGVEYTVTELISLAEFVTGLEIKLSDDHYPTSEADREHWCANPSLAADALDWEAKISLEEGLRAQWKLIS